jgi:GntR family transcriptional regulator, negative regulator for fad regulon and positive regulator of fabA
MADEPSLKPAEQAEQQIIRGILDGMYPPNSNLPAERQLATALGVTRPTLREVLQRMARNGWLEIHHGRSTRVRDYLREGSLPVLGLVEPDAGLTAALQQLRLLLGPVYTREAIEKNAADASLLVQSLAELPEDAVSTALYDWRLHYGLAVLSGNAIFALIWMDLQALAVKILSVHYADVDVCQKARTAYRMIGKAARAGEPDAAEAIMRRILQENPLK